MGGWGRVIQHEREQYLPVFQLKLIYKNNSLILQLFRVLDRQFDSMFRIFDNHTFYFNERHLFQVYFITIGNLQLGRIGHARILLLRSAPMIFVSAIVTELKMI